jgi:hypothetical protein
MMGRSLFAAKDLSLAVVRSSLEVTILTAIDEVRAKRPDSIETKSQEETVKAYAKLGA